MSEFLNMRTLLFVSGVVGIVLGAFMLHAWLSRRSYPGFSCWAVASLATGVAMLLLSLRDYLSDVATVVIANTLVVVSASLVISGLEAFAGGTRKLWLGAFPTAATAVSFWYFTYVFPSIILRIVIVSVILAVLYSYCAFIIQRKAPDSVRRTGRFLTLVFVVLAVWFFVRALISAFTEGAAVGFMEASTLQGLAILLFPAGVVGAFVGLTLMNSRRLESDLHAAVTVVKRLEGLLPICASCKKIRDEVGDWQPLETYLHEHSEADFSHGLCPDCLKEITDRYGVSGGLGSD